MEPQEEAKLDGKGEPDGREPTESSEPGGETAAGGDPGPAPAPDPPDPGSAGDAPPEGGGAAEPVAEKGAEGAAPMSARRKWGFRITGMTLVPLLFFLILEGVLRLFGFGYATDFFIPLEGHPAYRSNMEYTLPFFPPPLVRPPLPMVVPREKPEGAFRIFVLGGSAAQGDPSPP
ncbi:MAG: hypothetical protein ACYS47_19915, partial [Planctomycetota bacterium]